MSWRTRLRRLRFALMALLAGTVILLGVLAGLTQLAMPWLQHHPQHVERWLSDRLGRAVSIGRVRGTWIGGGPVLELDEVRIAGKDAQQAPLAIARAELVFDLYALFKRNRAVSEFRVSGLDLQLINRDGRWQLRGLDFTPSDDADDDFSMGALGAVELTDLKLSIEDAARDLHVALGLPVLRLLNRGDITRVVGRVRLLDTDSPPLDLVADLDINRRSGELYVGGRNIDLERAASRQTPGGVQVGGGRGDVQVWAHVQAAAVSDVRLRVDLHDVQFAAALPVALEGETQVTPRVAFDRLAFVARWLRDSDGWTFDLADLVAERGAPTAEPGRLSIERRGDDAQPLWRAGASALSLEPFGNLAMLSTQAPDSLRRWLYLAHPRGTLADARLRWRAGDDYDVGARLRGVDLASANFAPGVDHLDVVVQGDAQATLIELPQQSARIDYQRVFRKPFVLSQLGGDVVARRTDEGWRVETDRVGLEGDGFGIELRGGVDLHPQRRPSIDMVALISHADVPAAKLFWPTTSMSPKAIAWLDRGLVDGRIVEGRAAIRGELAAWPFHDHSGVMVARADVEDMTLIYDANWPRAEKVHAIASFVNDGLHVDIDSAEAMGNHISEASATIEDFGPLVLDLAVKGEGSGANLLNFMRATPVGKRYQDQMKDISLGGKGSIAFKLNLPIKQIETLALDGIVELSGSRLDHEGYDLHFLDASGPLHFTQRGLAAGPLEAKFREHPARLTLAVGGLVQDPRHAFEASVSGRFPAALVLADAPVLLPALAKAPGDSAWTANITIDTSATGDGRRHLSLQSDLRGTAIELPAPLAKAADAALPFRLDLDLPPAGQVFDVALGDVFTLKGRLPAAGKPFAARAEFGGVARELPPQGVVVGGRVATFDAGGWADLAEEASGGSGGVLRGIDLHTDEFVFGDRHFSNMHIAIEPSATAAVLRVDGEALSGSLTFPSSADLVRLGITAKFDRVHWPDSPPDTPEAPDTSALADIAPASLPPLHISVGDFRLGKASFGSAEFESHPQANGMRIDKLASHSPNVSMNASGDWTGTLKNNRSKLAIELSAQSLGHMMDALGFQGLIDGGVTRATIDATWPGPPSGFALPKLDGTLAIDVGEGRIPDVNTPSAGRIFGLFSMTEIPRRLSLDFSDFFKSGFSFNSIVGKFRLADGNAYTDGVTIKSPAAEIVVKGRTGLRAKDYDQQMSVRPHAGSTLPIVGAIAAGPVGAAAGLVMQGILNRPLGKVVAMNYSVTGSWEKPKIVLVSREKPARSDAAPGSVDGKAPAPAAAQPAAAPPAGRGAGLR
ncbi:MAG: YhdP family protein [Dokdonella sp.]